MLTEEETERWKVAKAVREAHSSWVVIWLFQLAQFRAYPKFRVRAGDAFAKGKNRAELEADMDRIEERSRPKGRSGGGPR